MFNLIRRPNREGAISLAKRRAWFVDATVTAANVIWSSGVRPATVKAGATITPGQVCYLDTTVNEHILADADTDTASVVSGISIDGGVDGRDMYLAIPGSVINVGFTTTAGTIYVLSTTAGGIAPWADLGTGDYVNVLFIGNGTAVVELICKRGTAVHA